VLDAQKGLPVEQRRLKLPIFKETTAQHFYSRRGDGEFESFLQESLPACWGSNANAKTPDFASGKCDPRLLVPTCVPVQNASNWRNKLLHKVHAQLGLGDKVPILPVYKYLLPRWDAHNDAARISGVIQTWNEISPPPEAKHFNGITFSKGGQDCTHYAYTPLLYAPIWGEALGLLRGWLRRVKGDELNGVIKDQPLKDWQ
jgi:hypothetical protein